MHSAVREMHALRDVEPEPKHEQKPERYEDADGFVWDEPFDVESFVDETLDE